MIALPKLSDFNGDIGAWSAAWDRANNARLAEKAAHDAAFWSRHNRRVGIRAVRNAAKAIIKSGVSP
jgi:hypothetical protein